MNEILQLYRLHRNWKAEFVASKLSMQLEDYQALESGVVSVEPLLAVKLSKLYDAPIVIFITNKIIEQQIVFYNNCVFNNSNGYVNKLY